MKKKRMSRKKRSQMLYGYLMIAPLAVGLGVFYFYPFFKVFYDSFHVVGAFNKTSWAGISNYVTMLKDPVMWSTLWNTFRYVIVIVPFTLAFSILIAALLNTNIKGRSVFRVIYFIPAITMSAAISMIWRWIFNSDFGILNFVLSKFGVPNVQWLSDPHTAWITISIVAVWMNVGYEMIILLAGMQGISRTYYESASLDGAGRFQQFRKITLPLLTPTIFFVLITTLISTFQIFDVIYMMINSKSLAKEASQSIVLYFYRNAFEYSKKGYASAIAIFLFLIIMIITAFQMKMQNKWVNYDQ